MKKRSKRQKPLSFQAKIKKADELRKKSNSDFKKYEKSIEDWISDDIKARNEKESKKITTTYKKQIDRLEKRENESYKKYHNFVHENFTEKQKKQAFSKKNGKVVNFMSKEYINRLSKTENIGKKTAKTSKKKSIRRCK